MKTAVSIPDDLFQRAEALAKRRKTSRSELYQTAISEYLDRLDTTNITERLNQVYATEGSQLDPTLAEAQARSLPEDTW